MLRFAVPLCVVLALPTMAGAQSLGEAIPGRGQSKERFDPGKRGQASRPCPEYGPGWVRLDGSTTCVRIGGAVRMEVGKSSRQSGLGTSTGGMVQLESRSETTLGPVRGVMRVQGDVSRNLETGPYPYSRW